MVVRGVVQGVGFRPFAYALARSLDLTGEVRNTGDGVVVEAEGDPPALAAFVARLSTDAPPLALVVGVTESAFLTSPIVLLGSLLLAFGSDVGDHVGGAMFLAVLLPGLFALWRWAWPRR